MLGTADLGTTQFNEKATIIYPLCPKSHFNKTFLTEGQDEASVSIAVGG